MISFKQHISESPVFYRGHDKGEDPMKGNKYIIWITPDKNHAGTYSDVVTKVKFNIKKREVINVREINRRGTVLDIFDATDLNRKKHNPKQEKLRDNVIEHFGAGNQSMDLPKFFIKVGAKKLLDYFKSFGYKVIQAEEDGILTYGIIK